MKNLQNKTISQLVLEYFEAHPNQEIPHGPVVDWVEEQYLKLYRKKPRDTWRAIRMLHQKGLLIKVKKGLYKYSPELLEKRELFEFTPELRNAIFERDGYKCVICGRTAREGVELHVDHILPKDKGGQATFENGQTLCSICNLRKKNYNQTESGKRMFIRLWKQAKILNDNHIIRFSEEVLKVYEKYGINDHIEWMEK